MTTPPWSLHALLEASLGALDARARAIDLEQAVHGIDALEELELQPILAAGLATGGFGVHREQRYPGRRGRRRRSEGERCDLVLTPDGRPLAAPDVEPTLFDPADAVPLEEAFWLEVKLVRQFLPGRPNRGYAASLVAPGLADVRKLAADPRILHAGLLLIVFGADAGVIEHDLDVWLERAIGEGLPVGLPVRRTTAITDRLGHAALGLALCPVGRRSPA